MRLLWFLLGLAAVALAQNCQQAIQEFAECMRPPERPEGREEEMPEPPQELTNCFLDSGCDNPRDVMRDLMEQKKEIKRCLMENVIMPKVAPVMMDCIEENGIDIQIPEELFEHMAKPPRPPHPGHHGGPPFGGGEGGGPPSFLRNGGGPPSFLGSGGGPPPFLRNGGPFGGGGGGGGKRRRGPGGGGFPGKGKGKMKMVLQRACNDDENAVEDVQQCIQQLVEEQGPRKLMEFMRKHKGKHGRKGKHGNKRKCLRQMMNSGCEEQAKELQGALCSCKDRLDIESLKEDFKGCLPADMPPPPDDKSPLEHAFRKVCRMGKGRGRRGRQGGRKRKNGQNGRGRNRQNGRGRRGHRGHGGDD